MAAQVPCRLRSWALAAAGLAAGCTPALDWRELRPAAQAGLVLLMPCRAIAQERAVTLAGQRRTLTLHVCDADERTWAVAVVDAGEPAQVGPVLDALRVAALSNLGATAQVPQAQAVPGATPQPGAGRLRALGRRPDGRPVALDALLASRGTVVVQASILGARQSEADADTLFASMRFEP